MNKIVLVKVKAFKELLSGGYEIDEEGDLYNQKKQSFVRNEEFQFLDKVILCKYDKSFYYCFEKINSDVCFSKYEATIIKTKLSKILYE